MVRLSRSVLSVKQNFSNIYVKKLTIHGILHYLWSVDQLKGFSQLIRQHSSIIFSIDFSIDCSNIYLSQYSFQ